MPVARSRGNGPRDGGRRVARLRAAVSNKLTNKMNGIRLTLIYRAIVQTSNVA